ncbi:MAG: hypothetical protein WB676_14410 [Bryobacteraceae bacterium]
MYQGRPYPDPDKPKTPDGLTLPLPPGSLIKGLPEMLDGHEADVPDHFTIGFDPGFWGGDSLKDASSHADAEVWEEWAQIPSEEHARRARSGPKTDTGKQRIRLNALKHGLCAKSIIVPGESQDDYDDMRADLLDQFKADTPQEGILVDQLAQSYWLLLRARRKETELLAHQANLQVWEWTDEYLRSVERFNRYRNGAERAYQRALATLQKFQREWKKSNGTPRRERVQVRHLIFNFGPKDNQFVLRTVSYGENLKEKYVERIPLSIYRNGLYYQPDPEPEPLEPQAM